MYGFNINAAALAYSAIQPLIPRFPADMQAQLQRWTRDLFNARRTATTAATAAAAPALTAQAAIAAAQANTYVLIHIFYNNLLIIECLVSRRCASRVFFMSDCGF